jgi:renalase
LFAAAHRWLYAKTETPAASSFGWDERQRIGVIGDWRIAPRIEAAWQSGHALARVLTD